jgi:hypothetical protein
MEDVATLSDQLTDEEWLSEFEEIGEARGYYQPLGKRHGALFLDESLETLIVSFDTVATARAGSASGIPHAMLLAELHGHSHISLIAREPTWFRDEAVYRYFDRLVDEAFFEDFDRVIFYGAGMGGYAAAAFSVAAPGATVILVAPQATLDPEIASWDDRFVRMRRANFRERYGYAPEMVEAAGRVILFYDPTEELDAMHAALFRGAQISKIRVPHGGPQLGRELQDMKIIADVVSAATADSLKDLDIYRALRKRRDYLPYLRNLLNRVHIEERHFLTALLCRNVSDRKKHAPRFNHHLTLARRKLSAAGRELPPVRKRRSAAELLPELRNG